jgi:EAL domain-containing protein (putative c-di-GMP-specific phosphodiesterase class I)
MEPRTSVAEPKELLLLVDDDFGTRSSIAAALERRGRTIITCSDLEAAQVLLDTLPIDATITDVRLSGQFGCEGLDLITYAIDKKPDARVVLITGNASHELRREASTRGAVALLQKPVCIDDIEAALGSKHDGRAVEGSQIIDMPSLDALLLDNRLSIAFQPIVDQTGEVFGYESLARIASATPLDDPSLLFHYAERKRRLLDIELACIQATFRNAASLPPDARIFINVHPHVLALGSRFTDAVFILANRFDVPLRRIVFEITEQAALGTDAATTAAISDLRDAGAAFAFDDVGVAYSHYTELQRVRPSFLKISQCFGTGFENDRFRTKIVRNIVSLAHDFAIEVILEGVESEATACAARRLGIRYMQGYWFGRPATASEHALAGTLR